MATLLALDGCTGLGYFDKKLKLEDSYFVPPRRTDSETKTLKLGLKQEAQDQELANGYGG